MTANHTPPTEPLQFVTLAERPELTGELDRLHEAGWPSFFRKDLIVGDQWRSTIERFPAYQFLCLTATDQVIACGHAIPFSWPGTPDTLPEGWRAVIGQGLSDANAQKTPNAASALAIVIDPAFQGAGLSRELVVAMKEIVAKQGITHLFAPLRPALKSLYPLIPMEDYVGWTRSDGLPFDPWIRTHVRVGAKIVKVAQESMTIAAPIENWQEWTGLSFLSSGSYVIKGGLVPLEVNLAQRTGTYREPNVWVQHN